MQQVAVTSEMEEAIGVHPLEVVGGQRFDHIQLLLDDCALRGCVNNVLC